jgi:hypothetical protein
LRVNHQRQIIVSNPWRQELPLTPKGPETIFKPFLKFGQAIVNL